MPTVDVEREQLAVGNGINTADNQSMATESEHFEMVDLQEFDKTAHPRFSGIVASLFGFGLGLACALTVIFRLTASIHTPEKCMLAVLYLVVGLSCATFWYGFDSGLSEIKWPTDFAAVMVVTFLVGVFGSIIAFVWGLFSVMLYFRRVDQIMARVAQRFVDESNRRHSTSQRDTILKYVMRRKRSTIR